MNSELFEIASALSRAQVLTNPLNTPAKELRALARGAVRKAIDEAPGSTLMQLGELIYLQGCIDTCESIFPSEPTAAPPASATIHDNSYTCQRCGRLISLAGAVPVPAEDLLNCVCGACRSGDPA